MVAIPSLKADHKVVEGLKVIDNLEVQMEAKREKFKASHKPAFKKAQNA